jgi:hypothetical protein
VRTCPTCRRRPGDFPGQPDVCGAVMVVEGGGVVRVPVTDCDSVGHDLATWLTVRLGLRVTHLAAHIVFGLNLGHSGEPTTAWPIGANTSATFVHHKYLRPRHCCRPPAALVPRRSPKARPGNEQPPRIFMLTFDLLCLSRRRRVQRVNRTGAPWPHRFPQSALQGRTVPATQTWRSPSPFSNPGATSGSLLPDSSLHRISRWLHHIHPVHCHHTVPIHLRNRPIITVSSS